MTKFNEPGWECNCPTCPPIGCDEECNYCAEYNASDEDELLELLLNRKSNDDN